MSENRYRPRSPPGSRRYHDPRASTGTFHSSVYDPPYSSHPRATPDAYPTTRHSSIYDTQPIKRYPYDPYGSGSISRNEYAMRPRNNSTLPSDNRRPLSIIGKNTSPTRNRPLVNNAVRDDPRSPTLYPGRDEGSRYLVPAGSHGHHQRHYSATRADIERINAGARDERSRGQYHQSGGYNQKSYPANRPTIKDEDFSYTGPREQFARDYPTNPGQRRDNYNRPPRPVSVMEMADHRPSVAPSRRDMPPPPPPSSTRQLDRLDRSDGGRLSIRPAPEQDLDRMNDLPQRRHSTRQPVVHQIRDNGYNATRDDGDLRPSHKARRDRPDDDDVVPVYRPRRERPDDDDPLPPQRSRKERVDDLEPAPRPRKERVDDLEPAPRPRRERAEDADLLPRPRRERAEDEEPPTRTRYREDEKDWIRERDYPREPEREVRDRDRDKGSSREAEREVRERDREKEYIRDGDRDREREVRDRDREKDHIRPNDRERERERVKSPEKSKYADDRHEVRSRDSSPEHQGAGKGVAAGLGGLAAAGLAGAAIKTAHKSEDASDSETRKEKRHRKHRHRDRLEDEEVPDTESRERRPAPPEEKGSDELRPPPARRDESASESHEDEHGRRRHRRHRHRDRDDAEALPPDDAKAPTAESSRGERNDPEADEDRHHRRRHERNASRVRDQGTEELERRTISPGENEDERPRRVQLVEPEKKEEFRPKGILKKPRAVPFPEDPNPTREGVAPLKDAGKEGVPPNARWTKISRMLVNPEALEQAHERFEERDEYVIVLRVVSREEITKFAEKTREIREEREAKWQEDLKRKGQDNHQQPQQQQPPPPHHHHHHHHHHHQDDDYDSSEDSDGPPKAIDAKPAVPPMEIPVPHGMPNQLPGAMPVPDIKLESVEAANYSTNV